MLNVPGDRDAPRPLLVYDGDCALCRTWVARAQTLDRDARVDTMSLHDTAAPRRTGRTRADLAEAVHLVLPDGTVATGVTAIREVSRYLRWGWLVGWVLWLPGAKRVADRMYARIAARRTAGAPTN